MAGRRRTQRTHGAAHTLGGIATAMVRELEAERAAGVTDDEPGCMHCGRAYVHGYESAFCSEACEGDYWHEHAEAPRVDEAQIERERRRVVTIASPRLAEVWA